MQTERKRIRQIMAMNVNFKEHSVLCYNILMAQGEK